jgi:hypothetical protein
MTEVTSSTVNKAMDWTVYEAVHGAVNRAVAGDVKEAVHVNVDWAVFWAVDWAVRMDWYWTSAAAHGGHPNHPALSDFLLEVDSGFR